MKLNLPLTTQWATGGPGKSDSGKSDLNLNLKSYEPQNYFGSGQPGPTEINPKLIRETP